MPRISADAGRGEGGTRSGTPGGRPGLLLTICFLFVVLAVGEPSEGSRNSPCSPWWIWLLVGAPALLLAIDLTLTYRGRGLFLVRDMRICCSLAFSCWGTSPRWRFSSTV